MEMAKLTVKEIKSLMEEKYEMYIQTNDGSGQNVWGDQYLELSAELAKREEEKTIEVFYEEGYRWSVHVEGEEESRDSNITKVEAMRLARTVKKELGNATISAQKLTKKERVQNIKHLHSTTETYHEHYKYQY